MNVYIERERNTARERRLFLLLTRRFGNEFQKQEKEREAENLGFASLCLAVDLFWTVGWLNLV